MRSVLATGLAAALLIVSSGQTLAASGNGATVTNQKECLVAYGDLTVCVDAHLEANTTLSPSGNLVFEEAGWQRFTEAGPGISWTGGTSFHFQNLAKEDNLQEFVDRNRGTTVLTVDGTTLTCSSAFALHTANGEIQYDHLEFACTPSA